MNKKLEIRILKITSKTINYLGKNNNVCPKYVHWKLQYTGKSD